MKPPRWLLRRRCLAAARRLARAHPEQAARFEAAAADFADRYGRLAPALPARYVTPPWAAFNRRLEAVLLPRPPFHFLADPVLRKTMFVRAGGAWMAGQLEALRASLDADTLRPWLREDPAGGPELHDAALATSHNTVHHASHLVAFEQAVGVPLASIDRVVEWGGGYGNLAKLFVRRHGGAPTYVLIDTPLFTCLQAAYLAATLGPERVTVLEEPGTAPVAGRVNLVPLSAFDALPETPPAELFVSTWALSESAPAAQDAVSARNWFGARHLLLAHQAASPDFPAADRVGTLAREAGARVQPVPFLPGNAYAFR